MSLTNLFTIFSVVTPAGTINQISEQSLDSGLQNLLVTSDGGVDPTFAAVSKQKPAATFSTTAIARSLGYAGWGGLHVTTALNLWFQKLALGGTRAGSGAHTKATFTNGLLVPQRITWDNEGQPATLSYQFWAYSPDGTTSPISMAINQSLPSAVVTREFFTAGPASVNGTVIPNSGGSIEFNFEPVLDGSDGEAYDTFCGIMRRNAVITLRSKDVNLTSTLGFSAAQTSTDSLVYLRKFAPGGTRVANGTAEHIKFTVDDGMITVRDAAAGDGQTAESTVEIQCTFDGTNDALAVNTASTIA
jgi:hypothetical protein